jgi:hypothetical protein
LLRLFLQRKRSSLLPILRPGSTWCSLLIDRICKLQNTSVRHKLYSHVCSKVHTRDSLYKSTIKVLSMLLRRNLSD